MFWIVGENQGFWKKLSLRGEQRIDIQNVKTTTWHFRLNETEKTFVKFFFKPTPVYISYIITDCMRLIDLGYDRFTSTYWEVAHAHWILEEMFEAGGPAGHTLLWTSAVAACSWKTAIAVQATLATASL